MTVLHQLSMGSQLVNRKNGAAEADNQKFSIGTTQF